MEIQIITLKLNDYGMYMAANMIRHYKGKYENQIVPPLPTNIRVGYVENSYEHEEGEVGANHLSTIQEGTDNTPTVREIITATRYRGYWTHDPEMICDAPATPKLIKWLEEVGTYGVPTVYYG